MSCAQPVRLTGFDTADQVAALTRDLTVEAFTGENLARQAHRDPTALSMSGLGGCTRACAYAVAGTPPSDVHPPEQARQAILGVLIHEFLLPWMARLLGDGAVFEQPVSLRAAGLTVPGTFDLAVPHAGLVWDVKSVREWRLHGVRRAGTYPEHRIQVLGYALALYQAGHPVEWVAWLYIDRSTGEVHVEVERFTNGAALAVVDRLEEIRYHAGNPDQAPRDGRGPGLSHACDRCPWLRRCWGDDAVPGQTGAQTILAQDDAGVAEALRMYADAAADESHARARKDFAKLVLTHTPVGVYGGWSLRRGRPGEQLDQRQVRADYETRGEQPPTMPTAGRLIVEPRTEEG